jgi:hypothetical protein
MVVAAVGVCCSSYSSSFFPTFTLSFLVVKNQKEAHFWGKG